jgi:hypothetical protein
MSVIPEKLRQAYHNDLTDVPLLLDAAEEIEQLQTEIERLKETNQKQYDKGYAHGLGFAKLERKAKGKALAKFVMTGREGGLMAFDPADTDVPTD